MAFDSPPEAVEISKVIIFLPSTCPELDQMFRFTDIGLGWYTIALRQAYICLQPACGYWVLECVVDA